MSAGILSVFAIATGFVAGGLLGSFYQLVTNRPIRFEAPGARGAGFALSSLALVFAGPPVLMRNAIRGLVIEGRPAYWLVLSCALSALWSFFVGLFILNIHVAISNAVIAG